MKLTIEIESDNDGTDNDFAVAELVRGIARKISGGQESGTVLDVNGNHVGTWEYERDEEEEEEETSEDSDDILHPEECPACGGDRVEHLGTLGDRQHYKCKSCGIEFSPTDD